MNKLLCAIFDKDIKIVVNDSESFDIESYKMAHDLHKLYASWRYKVLGFIVTINGALFYAYVNQDHLTFKIAISVTGIVSIIFMYFIDRRNYEIMKICISTASQIEKHRKFDIGIYSRIEARPERKLSYSYGFMILLLALITGVFWIVALIYVIK